MIFMNLRNFVDHISFVISSDWNFVRAFFENDVVCVVWHLTFLTFARCKSVRWWWVSPKWAETAVTSWCRWVSGKWTTFWPMPSWRAQVRSNSDFFFTDFLLKFNFSKLPKAQPNFVHFPGLHAMNGVKENLMIGKAVSVGSSLVLKKAKKFQSLYFLW